MSDKNITVEKRILNDTDDAQINAAYALGIVAGKGNGMFDPSGHITREQMAVMLTRTQAAIGYDISNPETSDYIDKDQFSAWAIPSIDYVTARGIMGGMGNNYFGPIDNCTREQAIVTFYRMLVM